MSGSESVDMGAATEGRGGRRGGGRKARQAARTSGGGAVRAPYVTRKLRPFEILDEEGLCIIEANADTVLEEIGIEFHDDAEALEIWRDAGAAVDGT
ncbi:MAG: trimethylamine methyltransferase family protein, partial [Alphaproteobacteria bacterium]|nr:trimethylamine methyltransferase family protein [Alphaproteobacteria bacterium]